MKFIKKIESFKNKQNFLNAFALLAECISILIILFLITLIIPNKNNLNAFVIIQILKLGSLVTIGYYAIKFKSAFWDIPKAASILDLRNNDKAETLLNAIELYFEYKSDKKEILERIYENAEDKIENTNLKADYSIFKKKILIPAICLLSFSSVIILSPNSVKQTANYLTKFSLPQKAHNTHIEITQGNKKILKNENLTVNVENSEDDVNYKILYKIDKIWREETMQSGIKLFPQS